MEDEAIKSFFLVVILTLFALGMILLVMVIS